MGAPLPVDASPTPDLALLSGVLAHSPREEGALALLRHLLLDQPLGRLALVSSFGAESAVLLHLVSRVAPDTPIIMLETGKLFEETLAYAQTLRTRFGLSEVRLVRPEALDLQAQDPEGTLHQRDTDTCCHIRKVLPLERALSGFEGWITGRKRFQASTRAALPLLEKAGADDGAAAGKWKVNPLAQWTARDLKAYADAHGLPGHPLVAKGYLSLGCAPCTTPVTDGEDPRAGRWRGQDKTECGIHFVNGKLVRGPIAAA